MPTRTRLGAGISLRLHILPNFIYKWGGKADIHHIKSEFEELNKAMKQLKQADQDVNIDAVLSAIDNFYQHDGKAISCIQNTEEDVAVIEFRALKALEHFHNAYHKISPVILKEHPELKQEFDLLVEKYKEKMSTIMPKIHSIAQEARRENIGREMIKDFDLRQLIAIYFQMRLRINDLYKDASKAIQFDKRLEGMLKALARKKSKGDKNEKLLKLFDNKFAYFIEHVILDAIFIDKMLVIITKRLKEKVAENQQFLNNLAASGFPMDKMEDMQNGIMKEVKKKTDENTKKFYQEERVMEHLVESNNTLN
ncbi:hypothetical protein H6503_06275 [Candidatus Woesearchaeota archaeon]|nr:hypothetical protein [Candidatus Woesearchaeota archaeon]